MQPGARSVTTGDLDAVRGGAGMAAKSGVAGNLGRREPQGLMLPPVPDGICRTAPGMVTLAGGGQPPGPVGQRPPDLPRLRTLPFPGAAASERFELYGNFTMLKYIENFSAEQLERRLGFSTGRLKPGFRIVALAPGQIILPHELVLDASTRWPDGNVLGEAEVPKDLPSPTERMLNARGQSVDALKQKVLAFFNKDRGNTPAKIIATWKHEDGMQYPPGDAIEGSEDKIGVPQFKLRDRVSKMAVLIKSL
jgi:hypothetical protein